MVWRLYGNLGQDCLKLLTVIFPALCFCGSGSEGEGGYFQGVGFQGGSEDFGDASGFSSLEASERYEEAGQGAVGRQSESGFGFAEALFPVVFSGGK